jgi:hypothetical protein
MKKNDRRRDRETTRGVDRTPEPKQRPRRTPRERDSAPTGQDSKLIGTERFPRKGDEE